MLMEIRIKKQNPDGIVRVESSGAIKEIMITEDFLKETKPKIALCFRGKNSSGIIELSQKEIEELIEEISPKLDLIKSIKIKKFTKE